MGPSIQRAAIANKAPTNPRRRNFSHGGVVPEIVDRTGGWGKDCARRNMSIRFHGSLEYVACDLRSGWAEIVEPCV